MTSDVEQPAGEATPPHMLADLGLTLTRSGDSEGAERAFRDAISADPSDAASHYHLGVLLHQRGESEGATKAFRSAIGADPSHAQAHIELGMLLAESHSGGAFDLYSAWRCGVTVMCWVLAVFGVAFFLVNGSTDDDGDFVVDVVAPSP